jgi:hypothetical protein
MPNAIDQRNRPTPHSSISQSCPVLRSKRLTVLYHGSPRSFGTISINKHCCSVSCSTSSSDHETYRFTMKRITALGAQLRAMIIPQHTTDPDSQNSSKRSMEVEDAPPSKFRRLERAIKITDIKLHSRLNIYDFVGYDVELPYYFDGNYNHEPENADNNVKMYGRIGHAAAVFGDREAIQYLSDIDDNPLTPNRVSEEHKEQLEDICYILARTQHWKGLKWVVEKGYSTERYTLVGAILGGASMKMLQWLHSKGCIADKDTFTDAAEYGNMEVMKWLRDINCPWNEKTFCEAVRHKNMDMLMWLKKEGCPWNEDIFEKAAATGNRDILLWLRVKGCPWDPRTFSSAIDGGVDILTLEWLHHEKCPWDEETFIAAVKRGDLDILRWLREKQCPWDEDCIHTALENKNGEVLEWLHEEKCPWNDETHNMLMKDCISNYKNK